MTILAQEQKKEIAKEKRKLSHMTAYRSLKKLGITPLLKISFFLYFITDSLVFLTESRFQAFYEHALVLIVLHKNSTTSHDMSQDIRYRV